MASTEEADAEVGARAPPKNVSYPLRVLYCGECTLPVEYCEYMPNNDKCKAWLEKHIPTEFGKIYLSEKSPEGGDPGETDKKGRQKRGGRGNIKMKKKAEPQGVTIARVQRNKKKYVTRIRGLATYEIDLDEARKFFANRFACGAARSDEDEIVIQGDVTDDIFDVIPEKWPEIDEENIDDMGDQKR